MGRPPKAFLERCEKASQYWDEKGILLEFMTAKDPNALTCSGNWIADTPIPRQSFETRERRLRGEDQKRLLRLVRKMLRWLPEERATAEELKTDGFLIEPLQRESDRGPLWAKHY